MSREDDTLLFGIGILAGVTTGIIAGLLFAPASGKETRETLEKSVKDFAETNCPRFEEVKKQTLASVDVLQFKIEKLIEKINNAIKSRQLAKAKEREDSVYGV